MFKLSTVTKGFTTGLFAAALLVAAPSIADAKTVNISKDSVLGVAYIDSKHESRDVFFKDYFPRVLPAMTDAGAKVLAKFETIDVEEGNVTPQHILLIEWPSIAAFETAAQDPRTRQNLSLRENALRDFRIGFFKVPQDTSVTFKEDVVYEWFGGKPASPETPNLLQTFFQSVIPTALEYGRADALQLQPVQYKRNTHFRPIAGLATWPTAAHFEQFTNTDVFRENIVKYRNPAFGELELINTYFVE